MFYEKNSKTRRRRLFFLFSTLLFFIRLDAQNVCFVSSAASDDSGDGSSWATAKKSIAAGIASAGSGGVVYVMAGTYATTSELTVPAGVRLQGGYRQHSTGSDTAERRLPGVNAHWTDDTWCTIISGAGDHRIATVNGVMEGCVVRNGFTSTVGGGLLIDGSTAIARYCVIKECDAINDDDYSGQGGGVYIRNNGMMMNCVVTECRADNGVGVAGEDGSLVNNTITRNAPIGCGYVVDYDGNYYDAVQIGTQCWMKQNLRVTHFPDGNSIPAATASQIPPCYYPNNNMAAQVSQYGLLYNWNAAMNGAPSSNSNPSGVQGVCPDGWHLPSNAEWDLLMNYVANQARNCCDGNSNYMAKAFASKTGWEGYNYTCVVGWNTSTNNSTRFSAMPMGYWNGSFNDVHRGAYYWASTQYDATNSHHRYFYYSSSTVGNTYSNKSYGLSVRCLRDASIASTGDMTPPFVTTAQVTNISATGAVAGGHVSADGGSVVTARGVCWNTVGDPTLEDQHISTGNGIGNYTVTLSGLAPNTTYYVRAYATNAVGTSYGATLIFTSAGQPCPGAATITDYDGNTYNTVQIGQQCWMKENLRATHYPNGSSVTFRYPNGQQSTVNTYGLLYNWNAVMNGENASSANPSYVQGICPTGWHLPSRGEFQQLISYVSNVTTCRCENNASYIAKSFVSTIGWENYSSSCCAGWNTSTNNASGFSAMPAGYYDNNYTNFGRGIWLWSTTADGDTYRYRMQVTYDSREAYIYTSPGSTTYLSVRCLKD